MSARKAARAVVMIGMTVAAVIAAAAGCGAGKELPMSDGNGRDGTGAAGTPSGEAWRDAREQMVARQIEARGVSDPRVLAAMRSVPRHLFVPEKLAAGAYEDGPLPIGAGQTISQPYIVALMTELLEVQPGAKILEVGTGSGYQAAVLAHVGAEVYSIEIVESLAKQAQERLKALGITRVHVSAGDGYRGWPEKAPFDGIIVTAAPDHVPEPLVEQLAVGGRMVIPVGSSVQELLVITKTADGERRESTIPVRFVPMTGEAEHRPH